MYIYIYIFRVSCPRPFEFHVPVDTIRNEFFYLLKTCGSKRKTVLVKSSRALREITKNPAIVFIRAHLLVRILSASGCTYARLCAYYFFPRTRKKIIVLRSVNKDLFFFSRLRNSVVNNNGRYPLLLLLLLVK